MSSRPQRMSSRPQRLSLSSRPQRLSSRPPQETYRRPHLTVGIAGAQVVQQMALHSTEQLRVGFVGNAEGFPDDCTARLKPTAVTDTQEPLVEFSALVGRMRQRFGLEDSPLTTSLITWHGTRDTCLQALKTLRTWGLAVGEVYCLAWAPKDPILSLVKPHIIVTVGPQPAHAP
ncbi:unnamed protein product [Lota lota]